MKQKSHEIWEELKSVLSGSTFDAILPPLIFVIVNVIFGLDWAVIIAPGLAVLMGVRRIILRQPWLYAFAGLLVVALRQAWPG